MALSGVGTVMHSLGPKVLGITCTPSYLILSIQLVHGQAPLFTDLKRSDQLFSAHGAAGHRVTVCRHTSCILLIATCFYITSHVARCVVSAGSLPVKVSHLHPYPHLHPHMHVSLP